MIICPYIRKSLRYVKQYKNNLVSEESGIVRSNEEVVIEEYAQMECKQEQCGVWHDGKCNYNQGVNG